MTSRTCPSNTAINATFDWTAEGRLKSATYGSGPVQLYYDAAGRFVRFDAGGAPEFYYLWEGANLLAELDGTGTAKKGEYSYYPGLDHLHALIRSDSLFMAQTDGLGSVIALTDAGKNVRRTFTYDDWGLGTGGVDNGNFGNQARVRWKGAIRTGISGGDLYYMRNRWYEPQSGRFLSEDPIGLAGGLNHYVYAENDPVGGADPTGLCEPGAYTADGYCLPDINVDGDPGGSSCEAILLSYGADISVCNPSPGFPVGPVGYPGGGGGAVPPPPGQPKPPTSGGGGQSGGGQPSGSPPPPHASSQDCAFALYNAGLTVVGDVTFFAGVGIGIKAGLAAENLAARGALRYVEGQQQVARLLYTGARVLRGESQEALLSAADGIMIGVPGNVGRGLLTGLSGWDFVPGVASYRAVSQARASCASQ